MLGIRHCQDVAIDLWQGDIAQFVNDVAVPLTTVAALIQAGEDKRARHAAVDVSKTAVSGSAKMFAELRDLLNKKQPTSLRRITFVLPDLEAYYAFQEAMFAAFPE